MATSTALCGDSVLAHSLPQAPAARPEACDSSPVFILTTEPRAAFVTEQRLQADSSAPAAIKAHLGGQSFSRHFFCLPLGCVSGSQNVAFTIPWPFLTQWAVWRRIPGGGQEGSHPFNPEPTCSVSGPASCQVLMLIADGKVVQKAFNSSSGARNGSSYCPHSCAAGNAWKDHRYTGTHIESNTQIRIYLWR